MKRRSVSLLLCMGFALSALLICNCNDKKNEKTVETEASVIVEDETVETKDSEIEETESEETSASTEEAEETEEKKDEAPAKKVFKPTPEPTVTPGLVKEEVYIVSEAGDEDLMQSYEYSDGKLIRETIYNLDGAGPESVVKDYTYDGDKLISVVEDNGTVLYYFQYTYEGDLLVNELVTDSIGTTRIENTYEYDEEGRLIVNIYSYECSGQESYVTDTSYYYDEWGYLIKKVTTDITSEADTTAITEFTYDDDGNMIERFYYNGDTDGNVTKVISDAFFEYDEEGRVVEFVQYNNDEDEYYSMEKSIYDEDGRLRRVDRTSEKFESLNYETYWSYETDSEGRVTKSVKKDQYNDLITVYYYE